VELEQAPTRRHFLKQALWLAGLSAFGVLPAGCGSRWALLPPRPIDWTMKPLSSARIEERALPGGRKELKIEHDLLDGVSPAMLVWFWGHIEGDIELKGRTYPRYLIFHPVDHIHFAVVKRSADGNVGVGSRFHLVEALGADMRHLIDVALNLTKLDETGAKVEFNVLGGTALSIEAEFLPQEAGTRLITTMTIGTAGWAGRMGFNHLMTEWFFPPERQKIWLKHSVEEIGNLQFFLPDLYRRSNPA
jgi:hypothetical protein